MKKDYEKTIKQLERDSQEFMKSPMGQRIMNAEYNENSEDIIKVLMNLKEPLTATVDKLREEKRY